MSYTRIRDVDIWWRAKLKSEGCLINRSSTKQSNSGFHVFDQMFVNKEDTSSISYAKISLATSVWPFVRECYNAWQVAHVGNFIFLVHCLKCRYFCQRHSNFFTNLVLCVNMAVVIECENAKWIEKNWPSYDKVSRVQDSSGHGVHLLFCNDRCDSVVWDNKDL